VNVLVSTTTCWNPGDDFIREGVLYLLEHAGWQIRQLMFYNRNHLISRSDSGGANARANTWVPGDPWHFDALVVAGTPDWLRSNEPVYQQAQIHGTPVYLIGIGAESEAHLNDHQTPLVLDTIKAAKAVICRDELAMGFCNALSNNARVLPCPALFAARSMLIAQRAPMHDQVVIASDVERLFNQAIALAEKSNCPVVLHNAYERRMWAIHHSNTVAMHSTDYRCLLQTIMKFKRIVSGRLHGAIAAAGGDDFRDISLLESVSGRVSRGWDTVAKFGRYAWSRMKPLPLNELRDEYMEELAR